MDGRIKSQRAFVGVSLITVLGVSVVLVVYATLLGTLTGGNVVVGGLEGDVYYSLSNVNTLPGWTTALDVSGTGVAWYGKINVTAGGYVGPASISFQLYKTTDGGTNWSTVGSATTITGFQLSGSDQQIFATSDGLFGAGNRDWSLTATSSATYRIVATINT